MSSSGNRNTEASMSPSSQENRENLSGLKSKITEKDSRSVDDLRDTTGRGSYVVTGANDAQQQLPELLTGHWTNPLNPEPGEATIKPQCLPGYDPASPRNRGT